MLQPGTQFDTVAPIIYWAQTIENVLIRILLHPEMDSPQCKESFERSIIVKENSVRLDAFCMEYKGDIQGVSKNDNAGENKEFDLDRKRDDKSIIDIDSLKDANY